jgi:hypothetical protein
MPSARPVPEDAATHVDANQAASENLPPPHLPELTEALGRFHDRLDRLVLDASFDPPLWELEVAIDARAGRKIASDPLLERILLDSHYLAFEKDPGLWESARAQVFIDPKPRGEFPIIMLDIPDPIHRNWKVEFEGTDFLTTKTCNYTAELVLREARVSPFHQCGYLDPASHQSWEIWQPVSFEQLKALVAKIEDRLPVEFEKMKSFWGKD